MAASPSNREAIAHHAFRWFSIALASMFVLAIGWGVLVSLGNEDMGKDAAQYVRLALWAGVAILVAKRLREGGAASAAIAFLVIKIAAVLVLLSVWFNGFFGDFPGGPVIAAVTAASITIDVTAIRACFALYRATSTAA